mmetsp:Transcript_78171/g.137992  ORF Transcript_78171/g.137992 Transcript_78171/m.137992 type:complete len:307 (+) Transcript_78171:325-1245(+)
MCTRRCYDCTKHPQSGHSGKGGEGGGWILKAVWDGSREGGPRGGARVATAYARLGNNDWLKQMELFRKKRLNQARQCVGWSEWFAKWPVLTQAGHARARRPAVGMPTADCRRPNCMLRCLCTPARTLCLAPAPRMQRGGGIKRPPGKKSWGCPASSISHTEPLHEGTPEAWSVKSPSTRGRNQQGQVPTLLVHALCPLAVTVVFIDLILVVGMAVCIATWRGPTMIMEIALLSLGLIVVHLHALRFGKHFTESLNRFFVNFAGHINRKGDVQGPLVEGVAMLGHPLPWNTLHATRFQNGSWLRLDL